MMKVCSFCCGYHLPFGSSSSWAYDTRRHASPQLVFCFGDQKNVLAPASFQSVQMTGKKRKRSWTKDSKKLAKRRVECEGQV